MDPAGVFEALDSQRADFGHAGVIEDACAGPGGFDAAADGGDAAAGFAGDDEGFDLGAGEIDFFLGGDLGNTFTVVMSTQPGCHGCLVAGLIPGPITIGDLTVPFAPPYFVLASQLMVFSMANTNITVPNAPGFVGLTIFFGVVTMTTMTSPPIFSQVATITVCP